MEATRGNSYAPVWGSLMMMMMRVLWVVTATSRGFEAKVYVGQMPLLSPYQQSQILQYL